jgi:hypothetical protein
MGSIGETVQVREENNDSEEIALTIFMTGNLDIFSRLYIATANCTVSTLQMSMLCGIVHPSPKNLETCER